MGHTLCKDIWTLFQELLSRKESDGSATTLAEHGSVVEEGAGRCMHPESRRLVRVPALAKQASHPSEVVELVTDLPSKDKTLTNIHCAIQQYLSCRGENRRN